MRRYIYPTVGLIVIALAATGFSFSVGATVVQTTFRTINNGSADFGSGTHSGGGPSGNATITFDWTTTATGLLGSTGRVQGTLYWDALFGGGCARLTIRFRNAANANLAVRTINECGTGGNANNASNQTAVDESFGSTALQNIVLTTSEVQGGEEVNPRTITIVQVTTKSFPVTIENGRADFGDGDHAFGYPQEPATVTFTRNGNATVTGTVNGILYWDAYSSDACSRLIIDFRNIDGDILDRDTFQNCGPGGNANDGANQVFVFNNSLTRGDLFDIRLRVDDTGITGDTISNTFGFGGLTP
jgi:hypothetical protein